MIWYTKAAQQYAVALCCELPRTQVCVVLVDPYARPTTVNDFVTLASKHDEVETYSWNNRARIQFSNGSQIYFVPQSESAKGLRPNLLIVDDKIDALVLRDCFLHHEVPPLLQRPIERKGRQSAGGNK